MSSLFLWLYNLEASLLINPLFCQVLRPRGGGEGQGKRPRTEIESIPTLMYQPVPTTSDIPEVACALSIKEFDMKAWLKKLTSSQLEALKPIVEKLQAGGKIDQYILEMMPFVTEYSKLQD